MEVRVLNSGQNIYNAEDRPEIAQPPGPKVFISHCSLDKPVARAITSLLSSLDVHYWLDEEDEDLQRAAALGMLGDKGLVHAIERGIRHATALLGLVSSRTVGSWWVPYEIGFSRAADKTASFLMLDTLGEKLSVPEYARIAAVYWSVDELARWASTLNGHHLHADLTHIPNVRFEELSRYVRLDPPQPEFIGLCERAFDTISLLSNPKIQDERPRRSLGVLVNPLFGFTPDLRPIYWRVLALQRYFYSVILGRESDLAPFDEEMRRIVWRFINRVGV